MDKLRKQQEVAVLTNDVFSSELVVVGCNNGIKADNLKGLRNAIRAAGGSCRVYKNTLIKRAISGSEYEHLTSKFKGPSILFYSKTAESCVKMLKVLTDFTKEEERLKLIAAGMMSRLLTEADMKNIASLPPMDTLRASFCGTLLAPAAKLVSLLQEPAAQIVRLLEAYKTKES